MGEGGRGEGDGGRERGVEGWVDGGWWWGGGGGEEGVLPCITNSASAAPLSMLAPKQDLSGPHGHGSGLMVDVPSLALQRGPFAKHALADPKLPFTTLGRTKCGLNSRVLSLT